MSERSKYAIKHRGNQCSTYSQVRFPHFKVSSAIVTTD